MTEKVNNTQEATSIIAGIPELIDTIISVIGTPYGWIVVVIFILGLVGLLLWVALNQDLEKVFELFGVGEKHRIEKFESYISKEQDESNTLGVIKDFRDIHYFKLATGIYAEKKLRDCLIALYNNSAHSISWTTIRRALQHIKVSSESEIFIKPFTFFEKVGYRYNQGIGLLFLLLAVSISSILVIAESISFSDLAMALSISLLLVGISMFMFSQNWSQNAAKLIHQELESQKGADSGK